MSWRLSLRLLGVLLAVPLVGASALSLRADPTATLGGVGVASRFQDGRLAVAVVRTRGEAFTELRLGHDMMFAATRTANFNLSFDGFGPRLIHFGGVSYRAFDFGRSRPVLHALALPHWALALLMVVEGLLWVPVRWSRAPLLGRTPECLTCGYDLRATPDRCPECGTAVTALPPAPAPTR